MIVDLMLQLSASGPGPVMANDENRISYTPARHRDLAMNMRFIVRLLRLVGSPSENTIHVMDSKVPTSNGARSGTTRALSPSNDFSALMLPSANISFSVSYSAFDGDDRAFLRMSAKWLCL